MNGRTIKTRLLRLEATLRPDGDGTFTLEELCRAMWRQDKKHFLKIAGENRLGLLVAQFEREDIGRNNDLSGANSS